MTCGAAAAVPPSWTPEREAQLRSRLVFLWNEVDLAVRNRRSNERDVQRQEGEFRALRLFDRIPFTDALEGLEEELNRVAPRFELANVRVRLLRREPPPPALPAEVYVDEPFRLAPEDVGELLHLRIEGTGTREGVINLLDQRNAVVTRLLITADPRLPEEAGRWWVDATAFRFRKIRFPRIKPRDPRTVLPRWARENPKDFAQAEPALWKRVESIEKLIPSAREAYPARERFLLNSARMSFFISKAELAGLSLGGG